ncbi:MAG: magnesium/cobalt transporter CorA [Cytophagaceae bacterium]|nr:magnesium/cobalt transporter CorA [Cytophagaceae bacterium]MDW8457003.1 magnesium/cobalt transporter CorA [Cytophagaceae bacterium]
MAQIKTFRPEVDIDVICYNSETVEEYHNITDLDLLISLINNPNYITWVNIDGTHCSYTLEYLLNHLKMHTHLMEEINNYEQRPRVEEFEDSLFVILTMLDHDLKMGRIKSEQISMILGAGYLITIQETGKPGDVFDSVRLRIKNPKGKHRKFNADYLLNTLIESVIDRSFTILEKLGDLIEDLEDDMIYQPTQAKLNQLYHYKRDVILLRRAIWPLREVLNTLSKDEVLHIQSGTQIYFRDSLEHITQVIETLESFREILAGLLEVYLSSNSNRLNNVMRVLTVISTIFMPLTFITGIYGMNFDNMPELHWKFGYYVVISVCLIVVTTMLIIFKRKQWI